MSGRPVALALVCLTLFLAPRVSIAQESTAPRAAAPAVEDQPFRVGGAVSRPVKISGDSPVYTEAARKARVQGVVILQAIIDEHGDVTNVRVLKGLPMGLDGAAIEAVKTWKFQPATLEGMPVKVYYSLTVNFQVDGGPYHGPGHFAFLAQYPDFAKALNEARFNEAAQILDQIDNPESTLARVYLLLDQGLLDEAWREALRYEGSYRVEAPVAVAAYALRAAQPTGKEGEDTAARAHAADLGLEAANRALEIQADSTHAVGHKMMLLREKARQTSDPAEKQRLTDEAARLEQRVQELRRATGAKPEPD
jgi:TonB family protein